MLLELPMHHLVVLLTADESLKAHVEDATELIFGQQTCVFICDLHILFIHV